MYDRTCFFAEIFQTCGAYAPKLSVFSTGRLHLKVFIEISFFDKYF